MSYSRVRNKHSLTLINFLTFIQGALFIQGATFIPDSRVFMILSMTYIDRIQFIQDLKKLHGFVFRYPISI